MNPNAKRNCIALAEISSDPSFENRTHAPQHRTQIIEYQNHLDLSASGIPIV